MAATSNIRLLCLLSDEPWDKIFAITIAASATVYRLKELIVSKNPLTFVNVEARTIQLYKVSLPHDNEVEEKLRGLELTNPLAALETLSSYFEDVPAKHHHIIVKYSSVPTIPLEAKGREQDDILTALAKSFKRATTITSESPTPSQAAKSTEYMKFQSGGHRILDGRYAANNPVNTVAPPIQLFNPAFAYFSSKASDPSYDVPDTFIRDVRDLMAEFAQIHTNEQARQSHLLPLLRRVIDHDLISIKNPDNTSLDFVALDAPSGMQVYLLVGEEKKELGDGGSDPSTQAALSFLHMFSQPHTSELRVRCCCSVFLLAHAGPWLTIMGGIIAADCVVQRLTDFLWVPVHSTHDDGQFRRIGRILYALRESIKRLKKWYKPVQHIRPFSPSAPAVHPRFFPSPNTFSENRALVKFEYQEPLERNVSCVTYRAITIENKPRDIVVKFVTSYGADAHRQMAKNGFAPGLLYYGRIDVVPGMPSYGDLRMVVMDYVNAPTLEIALQLGEIPEAFKSDLRRAIEELHRANYVFGDIQSPNVVVTPGGRSTAQLIDFDWAEKEDKAKYPVAISKSIQWPPGVEGLAPIRKEHDIAMLNALLSQCP